MCMSETPLERFAELDLILGGLFPTLSAHDQLQIRTKSSGAKTVCWMSKEFMRLKSLVLTESGE